MYIIKSKLYKLKKIKDFIISNYFIVSFKIIFNFFKYFSEEEIFKT
jgi:hypothetical protein